jgi:hypothetical protein
MALDLFLPGEELAFMYLLQVHQIEMQENLQQENLQQELEVLVHHRS